MDDYLDAQSLWRKQIPRDGSCLFRAVSEQVFHTQKYHLTVRAQCVKFLNEKEVLFSPFVEGSFSTYLETLSSPNEWAGHVEMGALAIMYNRDFLVFQDVGRPPVKVTDNRFSNVIMLCYSHGNHYDSVYPKSDLIDTAFCQSLVYGILYKDVFKLGDDVDLAVQQMLHDKSYSKLKKNAIYIRRELYRQGIGSSRFITDKEETKEKYEDDVGEIKKALAQGLPPFPYKVAKVLDPDIYRNVEYDLWNEIRKEQIRSEQLVIPDIVPGVKCIVRMQETQFEMHAHVQEMTPNHGPVTVFIEELGEKKKVPYETLQPIPVPIYKALAMEGSGKKRALHIFNSYFHSSQISIDRFKGRKRSSRKNLKDLPMFVPIVQNTSVIHLTHSPVVSTSTPLRNSYRKQQRQYAIKVCETPTKENLYNSLVPHQGSPTSMNPAAREIPYWNPFPNMFNMQQNHVSPINSSHSSTELETQATNSLLSIDISPKEESKLLDVSNESGFFSSNKIPEFVPLQNSQSLSVREDFPPSVPQLPFPFPGIEHQGPYPYGPTCPLCSILVQSRSNPDQENPSLPGDTYGMRYNVSSIGDLTMPQQGSLVSMPTPSWGYNENFTYVINPPPYGQYSCLVNESVVGAGTQMPYVMVCSSSLNTPMMTGNGPTMS